MRKLFILFLLLFSISVRAQIVPPSPLYIPTSVLSPTGNAKFDTARVFRKDSVYGYVTPTTLEDTAAAIRADFPIVPSLYYQTVQENSVSQTQRPRLNFSSLFDATDNAGNTSTDVTILSAPKLTAPVNIQGVSFDGSAPIDIINGTGFVKATATAITYDNSSYQPLDADLTDISGLTATTDNFIVSVASAWASRTPAQVKTTLSLDNVDNTTDLLKPISTATQTALNLKANLASPTFTGTVTIPTPFTIGAVSLTTTATRLNYLTSAGGTTGTASTNIVFSTSPTLVTPTLGVAKATSLNTGTTLNGTIFAKSANLVSLASTNHAFTAGNEASGLNIAFGLYSTSLGIQARNNGVASNIFYNPLGGSVGVGDGSLTGQRIFLVTNTGSGTGDWSSIEVRNAAASTDALRLYTLGPGFTTSVTNVQDGAAVTTGTGLSGGLSIGTQASADLRLYTNNTLRLTMAGATGNITTTGKFQSSGGGIGYTTGAGGTVTQGTSRTTTVVNNKLCGTITMFSAAQGSDAVVTFTLTNSFIEATDYLQVQHISATDGGAWTFSTVCSAGSATISIRNVSGGSITSATPLQFLIIKAVNN